MPRHSVFYILCVIPNLDRGEESPSGRGELNRQLPNDNVCDSVTNICSLYNHFFFKKIFILSKLFRIIAVWNNVKLFFDEKLENHHNHLILNVFAFRNTA